ncbi:MAG TPA: glycine oxidase ThiO [Candidatus Dormibacteraeota bacterium]|jgi:glycine oxidase|nr:glycine oxidase ThiO [Candidatus Dormibacteraeota bacterium]
MARVVVVGGGVIGCAVAERLSRERHAVTLLERDHLGAHASGAAAGMLGPSSEGDTTDAELGRRSLELFPELVARIERSGVSVEFREQETLRPALTASDVRRLKRSGGRWLGAEEALALEPGLNPRVQGAAVIAEAQITPPRFVEALARTAAAQGAEIEEGAPVGSLVVRGDRIRGVRTAERVIEADLVVLAAGPWSPILTSPLGVPIDLQPNRGQLVTLRPRRAAPARMLSWRGSYLVPKPDGTVIAGSTEEEAGFDARPTADGVATLLQFASAAIPALGAATVERVWAALRPATPSGEPIIGPASQLPGLLLATGHNRVGILLAPITAELICGEVARG